jgi:hypothetical protein
MSAASPALTNAPTIQRIHQATDREARISLNVLFSGSLRKTLAA